MTAAAIDMGLLLHKLMSTIKEISKKHVPTLKKRTSNYLLLLQGLRKKISDFDIFHMVHDNKFSNEFSNGAGKLTNTVSKCLKFSKGKNNTLCQAPQTFSLPLEQLLQRYYSCQGLNKNVSVTFYESIIKTMPQKMNLIYIWIGLD
jgi:hypothetical protein